MGDVKQDGAPPHWGLRVRRSIDMRFLGQWIGRGGPIPWPARSPDVTPLDVFFWGYVKDLVFKHLLLTSMTSPPGSERSLQQ